MARGRTSINDTAATATASLPWFCRRDEFQPDAVCIGRSVQLTQWSFTSSYRPASDGVRDTQQDAPKLSTWM
jgi:hypothetical protein